MGMVKTFSEFIKESVWSDMHKRSNGTQERMEDDINRLDCRGLYEYLKNAYESKSGYSIDDVIMINYDDTVIDIRVYENKNSMMGGIKMTLEFSDTGWKGAENNKTYATLSADSLRSDIRQVPEWLVKELEEFAVMNNTYYRHMYIIYPKDGVMTTNKFLIRVLDHILERMDDSVQYKVKLKKSEV